MMWVREDRNQFFRFKKKFYFAGSYGRYLKNIVSIVLEIALFWYILDFSIVHFNSI